eukprot:363239-Chlamydomonas_euryale.AAC.11
MPGVGSAHTAITTSSPAFKALITPATAAMPPCTTSQTLKDASNAPHLAFGRFTYPTTFHNFSLIRALFFPSWRCMLIAWPSDKGLLKLYDSRNLANSAVLVFMALAVARTKFNRRQHLISSCLPPGQCPRPYPSFYPFFVMNFHSYPPV